MTHTTVEPQSQVVERFVEWLRTEGYFMKKVDSLGNEKFVPTYELIEQYRLAGGFGRAQAQVEIPQAPPLF